MESWSRIPASKDKFQNISVDWNNWVDSDEEEEAEDQQMPNFDFGGAGDMEGDASDDGDEEEDLGDLDGDVDVEETQEEEKKE